MKAPSSRRQTTPHGLGQPARALGSGRIGGGQQVRGDLGVGLGGELDAGGLALGAQRREVLDDAVVDDRDRAVGGQVRVRVAVGRAAVRRPPGVADADGGRRQRLVGEDLLQVGQLAGLLRRAQLPVSDDRDACGVVAPVLQPAQALQDRRPGRPADRRIPRCRTLRPRVPGPTTGRPIRALPGEGGYTRSEARASAASSATAATTSASRGRRPRRACSCVGASTITRTSCSVPDGRSSTRPVSPSSASTALTAAATSSLGGDGEPVARPAR